MFTRNSTRLALAFGSALALSASAAMAADSDFLKYCEPDLGVSAPEETVVVDCFMDTDGRINCNECPDGYTALFIDLPVDPVAEVPDLDEPEDEGDGTITVTVISGSPS